MREIKFRAWDTNDGTMHVVSRIDVIVPKPYIPSVAFEDGYRDEPVPLSEVKLMQYTGLKDKNGKEIYEGDIYKAYKDVFIVRFDICPDNGGMCAYLENVKPDFTTYTLGKSKVGEVISNIYENPELLEVNHDNKNMDSRV